VAEYFVSKRHAHKFTLQTTCFSISNKHYLFLSTNHLDLMKTILRTYIVILTCFLFYSCKKDNPAIHTITTRAVTENSTTTAFSGGDVTNEG